MEEKHDPINDLRQIRQMMESSSRFISLSGLSGVMAGIYALIGVGLIKYYNLIEVYTWYFPLPSRQNGPGVTIADNIIGSSKSVGYFFKPAVLLVGIAMLVMAIITSFYFTSRKIKRDKAKLWSPVSKKLLINLGLPLLAGGWFCLVLFLYNYFALIPAVTLLFYGLALMNASKYTLPDIWYLGLAQILLGMINLALPGYGLYCWALGFGILHIVYGLIMYNKYERK